MCEEGNGEGGFSVLDSLRTKRNKKRVKNTFVEKNLGKITFYYLVFCIKLSVTDLPIVFSIFFAT